MNTFTNIIHNNKYKQQINQLPSKSTTEGSLLEALSFVALVLTLCFMFFVMNDPDLMIGLAAFVFEGFDAINNFNL